jgi:hypothetical protein
MNHHLHRTIGKIIKENFSDGYEVILDRACGGIHNIPFFSSKKKAWETELCNVDILITKNGKVKVIFEIEESNVKPTQICGKFLTSAIASYYIYRDNKEYSMDKSVLFIQILDTSKLWIDKTKKIKQWENIEKAIKRIIPIEGSRIDKYKLFYGKDSEFGAKRKKRDKLIRSIRRNLK